MTQGLIRKQQRGDLHFVTFSCYRRLPYLGRFYVVGYVVMPEHVHLLVSEPETGLLAEALKGIKLSVALRGSERPFWWARYYDFNVFTEKKRIEKLKYIHRNPVARGLVGAPEDWVWSSFLHYADGVVGTVEIESEWTAARRDIANDFVVQFPFRAKAALDERVKNRWIWIGYKVFHVQRSF
jgi:putative transposase